jgi:hypothetical protein
MLKRLSLTKHSMRTRIIQVALLCFIGLHSLGLLHHHVTVTEQDACLACQIVNHQALDVPDAASGLVLPLLALLFLVLPWHPGAIPSLRIFNRPRSRAPPFSFGF